MNNQALPPQPQAATAQTSGLAIASLVTGITCLSPVAIILGHVALSKIKKSAGTLKGGGMALAGLILGYVSLVLNLLVVIPVLFAASNAWKEGADRAACMINQRNIDQMIHGYASIYNVQVGDTLDLEKIKQELGMTTMDVSCPLGATLSISPTYLGPDESHVSCPEDKHSFNYEYSY